MSYQFLLYTVDDRVATITLNRPQRHNALSQPLVDEIMDAIAKADADPDVRVLIVTGAGGKAFFAGYDIKESAEHPRRKLAEWRARMQKDIRFTYSDTSTSAAVKARFSNGIATMIMPWLIGQRCRQLIYTGDSFDSTEAFRLGLVDKVFPKATVHQEATKIAKRMSRVSVDRLNWNKRSINQAFETMGLRSAIMYGAEASAIMGAISSPEVDKFDSIRRTEGLAATLKWRTEQFAPL